MANFYISAGVRVRELDLSNIVPATATSIAALVGAPVRGDVDNPVLVTTLDEFFKEFGYPVPGNYFHYAAIGYLRYGRQLWCQRVHNGALYGGLEIKTSESVQANAAYSAGESAPATHTFGTDGLLAIYAKDPGVWDNSISVKIENVDAVAFTFDITVGFPDKDGNVLVVEKFVGCSRKYAVDGFGIQRYVVDKTRDSKYIRVLDNTLVADSTSPKAQASYLAMDGGTNGAAISDSHVTTGWEKFADPESINVNILINGGLTTAAVQNKMIALAEARKDCFAILDMPYTANANVDQLTYRNTTLAANTSYAAIYSPWYEEWYDQWNDRRIPVPASGFVAGNYAYTDQIRAPWFSPAGMRRGQMPPDKLRRKYSEGDRDTLNAAQINTVQFFTGEGNYIWFDSTLQTNQSALSYVSIRRMLIVIEKSLARATKIECFEPNDPVTRLRIEQMCTEYLESIQRQRGIEDFQVVCSEQNNPPSQRELGQLSVDIYIKPVYPARTIQITAILTRLSANFSELSTTGV